MPQTWVWHKPCWGRSPIAHHRATRTYTGLGKQTLGGHKQNLVHTRTQEKRAMTPQETDPDLPVKCPGVSGGGLGQWWPAAGLGALSAAVCAGDILKAVPFITSTIVWPQVNSMGGIQLLPSTGNWIKNLLSMAPPIRTRPNFPLSQSLPSGSLHKPLILLFQRTDRLKTTITEN